jgi:histone deacetylase 1/2
MKDLGDLHFFLGMEVERDRAQHLLYINQIGYLKEILKRSRMEDCKAIEVPFDPKTKSKKIVNKDDEMIKFPYQQSMGSLMYTMLCTRSDLAYSISVVSQHMANPSLEHWITVKRIFQYLQGILQFKLRFGISPPQDLVRYCDADWASDLEDRRSTTRFICMIGGGAISWNRK